MNRTGVLLIGVFLITALHAFAADIEAEKRLLKSANAANRGRASDEIIRKDAVRGTQSVIDALRREKDKTARLDMINALGNSGTPSAVTELIPYLKSNDPEIRLQTAGSLAQLGNAEGLDELAKIALDQHEERGRRSYALRSLGGIKENGAIDVLEKALAEKDAALRSQAVASLGQIDTPRSRTLVGRMRGDADQQVKKVAEGMLKRSTMK